MNIAIAYCVAGLSTFALIVLWFLSAHKTLYRKRDAVYKAQEELRLHQNGYEKRRGSPEEPTAKHMLDTSIQIYEQIRTAYNKAFKNPVYRVPGVLMGFKSII
ncbi:MAG: hypothetical protein M0R40_00260 [Firmicutes bacterium]|nr:hypothetical protein [Bacillota bacterium]